jgi:hypothetical protein
LIVRPSHESAEAEDSASRSFFVGCDAKHSREDLGMTSKRAAWCVLMGVLAIAALAAHAQWKDWDYELDQERKPWQELQLQLPPYPKNENLLAFDVGSNSANRFFIDAPSVSVGEDGIVRYTLVVRAGGGATNVSFEGIRCETNSQRVYAFGHPGNQWSRARNSEWRAIVPRELNGHHYQLAGNFMCLGVRTRAARSQKEILAALKSGRRWGE